MFLDFLSTMDLKDEVQDLAEHLTGGLVAVFSDESYHTSVERKRAGLDDFHSAREDYQEVCHKLKNKLRKLNEKADELNNVRRSFLNVCSKQYAVPEIDVAKPVELKLKNVYDANSLIGPLSHSFSTNIRHNLEVANAAREQAMDLKMEVQKVKRLLAKVKGVKYAIKRELKIYEVLENKRLSEVPVEVRELVLAIMQEELCDTNLTLNSRYTELLNMLEAY